MTYSYSFRPVYYLMYSSQVCDNVALYAQKYDEEFSSHLQGFVTAIWGLLVTTGQEVKYDLVSKGHRHFGNIVVKDEKSPNLSEKLLDLNIKQ